MKTKLLLLWLLLLCIPGLKAETIFRLTLTDVPEGLDLQSLVPSLSFILPDDYTGGYEKGYNMSYEEGTNSYVLNTTEHWELEMQDLTEGTLTISGAHLIPPLPIIWKVTDGQKEQNLEYSMNEFQRFTLVPEEGWNLWEKKDEQTAFLPNIYFGYFYDENTIAWGGYTGEDTVPANEAEYHIYALPGSYFWRGTLYKNDGSKKIMTTEEPVVLETGKPEVTLNVDWANRTEVTPRVTGMQEDLPNYFLYIMNDRMTQITSLESTILLNRDNAYQWVLELRCDPNICYIGSQKGSFTPTGEQKDLIIDFSDYIKTQIDFIQDQELLSAKNRYLSIEGGEEEWFYQYLDNVSPSFPVYLPKNKTVDIEYGFTFTDKESQDWPVYPLKQKLTADQEKQITIRTSDFHKVSLVYDNQPINTRPTISPQEYPDDWGFYASEIYMPNGNYHAETEYPGTSVNMTCDFTVNGKDRIIDFKTMADNFRTIFVSIKNADLMPSDIESPYANFTFSRGEYGENFNLSVDLKEGGNSIFLPEGTYTYQVKLESPENQIVTLPINGTIEVTDNSRELVFDLDTCCIAPLKIKDESGNLLPSFHSTLNNNADLLQKYNTPSYIMLAAASWWRGQLNVYAAGYEAWKKVILINQTPAEINVELKKAEIFPIFIIPEDLKEGETAEIQVEGIGSCYYSHETGFTFIPLSFMQVAAGTYNVTILADGHETVQGQIVVDRSMCPEGSSEIVYKISMENGFTGVQQTDAAETLDIRSEGAQIVIDSETDCRAEIYTLSGVCVAHLKGKNMRSEALAPGIYLVLARNAQGTLTRKITIGN